MGTTPYSLGRFRYLGDNGELEREREHRRVVKVVLHNVRIAPLLALVVVGSCDCGDGGADLAATVYLAVDGTAEVLVDDEVVGTASGWTDATTIDVALAPGEHSLTLRHLGDGEGALAAWMQLPDGTLLVTDGGWSGAADLGGYGAWPWGWSPREMEGTGARWLRGASGGEATMTTAFEVGESVAHAWSVWPDEVEVGGTAVVEFTFTTGTVGLAEGESHTLDNTVLDGSWGRGMPYPRWSTWQTDDPDAEGYLSVAEAPDGVEIDLIVVDDPGDGSPGPYVTGSRISATLRVTGGSLAAGDPVVLRWGTDEVPVVAPAQARRYTFPHSGSEAPASMLYPGDTLGRSPHVDVVGGEVDRLVLAHRGGSAVAVGETTVVQMTAVDEIGNPVPGYEGTVVYATGGWASDATESVVLGPSARGRAQVDVTWAHAGMHQLIAESEPRTEGPWIQVTDEPPAHRLYFGDPHSHSLISDGTWSAEAAYRHADEIAGLDFAAVTDHAERVADEEWDATVDTAAYLTRDDFAVLVGYEWTGRQAEHRCVYSLDGSAIPVARTGAFGYTADPLEDVADLWSLVDGAALVVPHHPGSAVGPAHHWADHDPDLEPVVEIYSKHGSSECFGCEPALGDDWALDEGNYVRDGLADGLRFGFIGGGDGHEAPLGGMEPDHADVFGSGDYGPMARRGGLTGVWAASLAPADLLDAWQDRRTFATTGARIFVQFTADEEPMGSEITVDAPPEFGVTVGGTDDLTAVLLVRYTEDVGWEELDVSDDDGTTTLVEVGWTDEDLVEDAVYYIRVEQADGHRAWSSPIWVSWE